MTTPAPRQAILQVADTGPLESLVVMLRSVGYRCRLPGDELQRKLRAIGCDTVLTIDGLVENWGYARPFALETATIRDMKACDLYVDVKAHRCYPKIVNEWPNLKDKVLWYRINGGRPEHVINERGDHGDEVNPPCPVLTPNQWYSWKRIGTDEAVPLEACRKAYACWPPFYRADEYSRIEETMWRTNYNERWTPPLCLIHNLQGWGYGKLADPIRKLGVKLYGAGSPDGLIQHHQVKQQLFDALCMVHLKSSDAPGYALYEALAAGCPVVCTRRLIWRCRMEELLIPGKTCLVFDRETHDGLTDEDVTACTEEIGQHLRDLQHWAYNRHIGMNGRKRLHEVMWNEQRDAPSLRAFTERHYT